MRRPTKWALLGFFCALLIAGGAGAAPARSAEPLFTFFASEQPLPGGEFDGPCGLAVDSGARFYVSDYYRHAIDIYNSGRVFQAQLKGVGPLDGPCGVGVDSSGNVYVNDYHRSVEKFVPSSFPPSKSTVFTSVGLIDSSHPTGLAIDPASDDVYVNARTHIAAYNSSGAPLLDGGDPLEIGHGSLGDGYGLALSAFPATAGRLYVPDAVGDVVRVYDPLIDLDDPVQTIAGPPGGFGSLQDSAIAVDRVTGQIYVADTLGAQFSMRPEAAIHVFDATGAYQGRLKYNVVDGSPLGLAVDNSTRPSQGRVYVTSGNASPGSVYAYPPGAAGGEAVPAPFLTAPSQGSGSFGTAAAAAAYGCGGACAPASSTDPTASSSVITQKGNLRVSVTGKLAPKRLPREGVAPISVSVGGEISTTDRSLPPQLEAIRIELNRHGRLDRGGLPSCQYNAIQPGASSRALRACRSSLVGQGSFTANITLAGQEPYPTRGKLLVFNGTERGKPVLYGHIYAPRPFATSFVLVFSVQKLAGGTYGTALDAPMPAAMDAWGRLTGLEMTLSRRHTFRGRPRSFISAGCPAPDGFPGVSFPLARTEFSFAGGRSLSSVLSSTCKVKG